MREPYMHIAKWKELVWKKTTLVCFWLYDMVVWFWLYGEVVNTSQRDYEKIINR